MFSFYSKRCYLGELDLLPFKDTFCIEFMSYSWHIHNSGNLASRIFLLMKSLSKSLFSSRLALIAKHYSVNIDFINSITSSEWRQYVKNSVRNSFKLEWSRSVSSSKSLNYGYSLLKTTPSLESFTHHSNGYISKLIIKLRSGTY